MKGKRLLLLIYFFLCIGCGYIRPINNESSAQQGKAKAGSGEHSSQRGRGDQSLLSLQEEVKALKGLVEQDKVREREYLQRIVVIEKERDQLKEKTDYLQRELNQTQEKMGELEAKLKALLQPRPPEAQ